MALPDLGVPRLSRAASFAAEFAEIKSRIEGLEKSRPRTSFGHGPPTAGTGEPGTAYVDLDNLREYVRGPEDWISADLQRAYDEKLDEWSRTASASDPWQTFDGPMVTVDVPPIALVVVYAEFEGKSTWVSPWGTQPVIGLYEATDFPTPREIGRRIADVGEPLSSIVNYKRTLANANPGGQAGAWPRGDLLAYFATAGTRTYELRYRTGQTSGTFQNAYWQNRRLLVMVF